MKILWLVGRIARIVPRAGSVVGEGRISESGVDVDAGCARPAGRPDPLDGVRGEIFQIMHGKGSRFRNSRPWDYSRFFIVAKNGCYQSCDRDN